MSSERDIYYAPPPLPPRLIPVLLNNISPHVASPCTLGPACNPVSAVPYLCQSPEQELLGAQNRLWSQENSQDPPIILYYRYIEPVLQDGPKCGLVALSMAASITPQPLSVDFLLREAMDRGFTNHGEMFSVDCMAVLAQEVLGAYCQKIEILAGGLGTDRNYILHHLTLGSLLLIPYDADANHAPCCRRGHKAHWALVVGVMLSGLPARTPYLLARQGKSRHLAVWGYDNLRISNENLLELDPGRATDGRRYILPPGGVSAGLQGRALFLHGIGL